MRHPRLLAPQAILAKILTSRRRQDADVAARLADAQAAGGQLPAAAYATEAQPWAVP